MSLGELLVFAACGAAGGAVGWALGRLLPKRGNLQVVLSAAMVAVAVTLASTLIVPRLRARREPGEMRAAAMNMFGDPGVADDYVRRLAPLMHDPRLPGRIEAARAATGMSSALASAKAAGSAAVLSYAGMARLTPAELETSLDLRRRLGELSRPVCVGLWKGGISAGDLAGAIRRLPSAERRKWAELTVESTTRELAATAPVPRLDDQAVGRAWGALFALLPESDGAVLERASKTGPSTSDDDACRAFQILAASAGKLPPAERDTLIRGVTCPFLVGH